MAIDDDLSALMPDPPPPRPARREAAIEQALRRFDGEPAPTAPARARPAAARAGWGRPQIAALASVALVVLVSVPVWWAERDRFAEPRPRSATTAPTAAAGTPAPAALPQVATTTAAPPAAAPAAPTSPSPEPAPPAPPTTLESNLNRLPQFVPPPPSATASSADALATRDATSSRPPAAPPRAAPALRSAAPRAEAEADERIVVTGARIQRQDQEAATPVVAVDESLLDTAGDWNACTIHDRNRDPAACRALADPAAPGASGRAAAQLADGLELAWQGDLDRAIDAFDRAIAADPGLSIAYLNRGLARQAKGDLRRALADLDRAVAKDRNSARGYFHRSLVHRARGEARQADADGQRAIELDPRYRAVLP